MTAISKNPLASFPSWIRITPTSLSFSRRPKFEEWQEAIPLFAALRGALPFWIGDYVNLGEDAFHDKYTQAIGLFGQYEYHTISNYASVCRRVAPERRVEGLSYSHHAIVAKLEPEKQTYWLKRAFYDEAEGRMLTVDELDELVNGEKSGSGGEAEDGDPEERMSYESLGEKDGDPEERMSYESLGEKVLKLLVYMGNKAPDSFERELIKSAMQRVRDALGKPVVETEAV